MRVVNCVNCRRDIADGSNFCPYCGTTQPAAGSAPAPGPASTPMGGVRSTPAAPPPAQTPQGTYSQGGVPQGSQLPGASQRATMSMILGIASLGITAVCCWCYGLGGIVGAGLGITAFVMGRNELEDIAGGFSSPAGQSTANLGKTLGLIGAIVGALSFVAGIILLIVVMATSGGSSYNY